MADAHTLNWHRLQIIKAARSLFANGDGVIEDALSAVLEAARREFNCTVRITKPMHMRVDGYDYQYPEVRS
jgi:hypothetical protein